MSDETLRHAERIGAFLADEIVVAALDAMKQVNYDAFLRAKDDESRRMAHAKAVVLDEFVAALQGVVDAGTRVRHEAERRDRAPLAHQPRG